MSTTCSLGSTPPDPQSRWGHGQDARRKADRHPPLWQTAASGATGIAATSSPSRCHPMRPLTWRRRWHFDPTCSRSLTRARTAPPPLGRAQAEQAIETRCSEVVQHTQPKRLNKLLAAAHEIATIPPTGNDFVLTHAVLCQVGLPRSKVEGREFHRRSG